MSWSRPSPPGSCLQTLLPVAVRIHERADVVDDHEVTLGGGALGRLQAGQALAQWHRPPAR